MQQLTKANFFEKIVIKDPSVLACSWLLVQILILAQYFDRDYDPSEHKHRSTFQHWYGYWVFAPTYAFYLVLVVYITMEQAGSSQMISQVYGLVAPRKDPAGTYNAVENDLLVLQDLSVDAPSLPEGGESAEAHRETVIDDYIDGYKMTPQDFARESSLNRSLINKVLWTFPSIFLASSKISFDIHREYSWHLVLLPLYIYIFFLLFVAVQRRNWFMHTQREIDVEDRRIAQELKKQREKAHTQLIEQFRRAPSEGEGAEAIDL